MKNGIHILFLILLFAASVIAQPTTRFMVVSDTHIYSPTPDFSQTILYEITLAAIEEKVSFIFFTGDLAIGKPADSTRIDSTLRDWRYVLDTLRKHNIKVYACRGNMDIGSGSNWDSLFEGDFAFPKNGPDTELNRTYAIEDDNILFISLDQFFESHRINQQWLDKILTSNTKPHLFVAAHEPAFKLLNSNCMGAYPDERNIFWESLTKAGVKIYFCGHDHFFDHTVIRDSTGVINHEVHQVISGTGGGSFFSDSEYNGDNGKWKPTRILHDQSYGYVLIEANATEVQMTWKHRTGKNIFEDGGDSYLFSPSRVENFNFEETELLFYPNPFSYSTTLKLSNPSGDLYTLCIFDLNGKLCKKVENIITPEYNLMKGNLKAGFYFVELRGTKVFRGTLLVQ